MISQNDGEILRSYISDPDNVISVMLAITFPLVIILHINII